jgi:hypothetical protein
MNREPLWPLHGAAARGRAGLHWRPQGKMLRGIKQRPERLAATVPQPASP